MFGGDFKKNQYPQYEIYIILSIMKNSFKFYLLSVANVVILLYNLDQTFIWFTCMEIKTCYILERMEYIA